MFRRRPAVAPPVVDDTSQQAFAALLAAAAEPVVVFGADGQERGRSAAASALSSEIVDRLRDPSVGEVEHAERVSAVRRVERDGVVVCVLDDVTDAVDFREARRQFSAAAAHELRTPLARILALAETLELPVAEAERREIVTQIERQIEEIGGLLDGLLLLAALDRGEVPEAGGGSDARAVCEAVVGDRLARRIGRGRSIVVNGRPGLHVAIAPALLGVVVGNVIDNALRHAGSEAAVTVDAERVGERVVIRVRDDGPGIPAAHAQHVFQRFYRVDAARGAGGTGLGLALVRNIVERHSGRAAIHSAPGDGTEVTIDLAYAPPS